MSRFENDNMTRRSGRAISLMRTSWRRMRGEMGLALIRTFVARGIAATGTLALALVVGQIYGPAGMGVYALAQSLLLGVATLARQGMQNSLMRYVGQDHASPAVPVYLRWALRRALLLSSLAALVILPL